MSSNAIAQHFHEMLTVLEQTRIGCTPNVTEDVRVMRLLVAYHKRGVELAQAIEAGNAAVKWAHDATPLLERGGGFENRSYQICRWLMEMRAVETVGGTHAADLATMLRKMSVFLVGEEKTAQTQALAEGLQRKALGHTGEEPKAP